MFAAAGNNGASGNPLAPNSSPRTTVFPARYDRVVSVLGVTGDELTYAKAPWRWDYLCFWRPVMRGNYGPSWVMDEAIAAWTPNVPWLVFRTPKQCAGPESVRLNGAGTSAATPQVAAAAAQWLQYHIEDPRISEHWRSWQKVEAVYRALLENARPARLGESYTRAWLGRGIVRAETAIRAGVPDVDEPRPRAELDTTWLAAAILSMLGGPATEDGLEDPAFRNMLATEVSQLAFSSKSIAALLEQAGPSGRAAGETLRRHLLEAVARDGRASGTLRTYIHEALEKKGGVQ
jgi:hypothetical protein